jgi:hypothetical protein
MDGFSWWHLAAAIASVSALGILVAVIADILNNNPPPSDTEFRPPGGFDPGVYSKGKK